MTGAPADYRLIGLSTLVQLEREARHATTHTELGFVIVNETHRLVPYHQAVLWRYTYRGRVQIAAISAVTEIDEHAPYVRWLKKLLLELPKRLDPRAVQAVSGDRVPAKLGDGWDEWCPGYALWCPLIAARGDQFGGLFLTRQTPWEQAEIALIERLVDAYGHAWSSLRPRGRTLRERTGRTSARLLQVVVLLALIALLGVPVRLSVLSPADVAPVDPAVISSPIDGVIKDVLVEPNAVVQQNDVLFRLDDTVLGSRHEVAKKALAVAQADYLRLSQQAFSDAASKAELAMRSAVVQEKTSEVEYTARLLERAEVRAPRDGIVVYSDRNDWLGRPVTVGQKVMTLADPARVEVQAWVPVGDAINLQPGAEVRLFLNTDPTRPLEATLQRASYEAEQTPAGVLAFRVKAAFPEGDAPPRIGLKGTAKIYGEKVPLFYYLLRRPLSAARQWLGL